MAPEMTSTPNSRKYNPVYIKYLHVPLRPKFYSVFAQRPDILKMQGCRKSEKTEVHRITSD